MRYVPPSRRAEPSFYTLEGDPVVFATATWKAHDRAAAAKRMRELAALGPNDPLELDITAERAALVTQRPPLPPGALVLESSPVGAIDTIPIASLRLEGDELRAEAMSEQRLEQTLEIVDCDFGPLVKLRDRAVTSVDDALAARRSRRGERQPERVEAASSGWSATSRSSACADGSTSRTSPSPGALRAKPSPVRIGRRSSACFARSRTAPSAHDGAGSQASTWRHCGTSLASATSSQPEQRSPPCFEERSGVSSSTLGAPG